jgi:predicted dehydrogenase
MPMGWSRFIRQAMKPGIITLLREFERNDMFLALMKHFLESYGEAAPVCSLDDGIKALQLALAAHRSAHEGQAVSI